MKYNFTQFALFNGLCSHFIVIGLTGSHDLQKSFIIVLIHSFNVS